MCIRDRVWAPHGMLGAAAPSRLLGPAFHAGGGCPGIGLDRLGNPLFLFPVRCDILLHYGAASPIPHEVI